VPIPTRRCCHHQQEMDRLQKAGRVPTPTCCYCWRHQPKMDGQTRPGLTPTRCCRRSSAGDQQTDPTRVHSDPLLLLLPLPSEDDDEEDEAEDEEREGERRRRFSDSMTVPDLAGAPFTASGSERCACRSPQQSGIRVSGFCRGCTQTLNPKTEKNSTPKNPSPAQEQERPSMPILLGDEDWHRLVLPILLGEAKVAKPGNCQPC
jgi:hypothetical protein